MPIIEDLIVSDHGAFVGLHSERLRLSVADQKPQDAPLMYLQSVQIVTRSASLSASALYACCEAGIPIHFIDPVEGHYASLLSSKLTTVVATRRAQLEVLHSPVGVRIAQALAAGKLQSQAANLRYIAKRQDETTAQHLRGVAQDLLDYADRLAKLRASEVEEVRQTLMGIEGRATRLYWEALGMMIPEQYAWQGRTGRHASDSVNVLLNYGYGILYGEVQNALAIAGLEPYAGLIHTDRPGKPSLTCDLIEEFRAPIVDRTVIGLVNRHYEVKFDEHGRLERNFRRDFAQHILSRLHAQGVYEGKRYALRSIIQRQARRLAAAFRGEKDYEAYTGG
ncbi:MAG: CRISPR-associated endonuclease Cas1 [Anaerolineae bacterium]|nr:CRISPR-associated endonuclease Cas1 [Anaerolineae bacterium]MDW8170921.1 CRISPR-associated endonuclease Cas1 [Anaerolineae bacterium]